jgi:phage baseplate assembly protein W
MTIQKSDNWAFDLDVNISKNGEITDIDVINNSIDLILSTTIGERLFNPAFGSRLNLMLFEGFTESNCESILNTVINDIRRWEDRIIIAESKSRVYINTSEHYIILQIPYMIKKFNIGGIFTKKIVNI